MTESTGKLAPFNQIQGIASSNVPAYSNAYDDFISFEGSYIHGIFTGFKWQCVEFARRWLLIRKSCIFRSFGSAADMWHDLTYVERITDGQQFFIKTYPNGSPSKPTCDSFLIYPRGNEIPFGHIAVICEVQEDFIRVAEENYRFQYWPNNYSRQIPLSYRDNLYYLKDYYEISGWMEIANKEELEPLDKSTINSILKKYQQPKPVGKLERCFLPNKIFDWDYSSLYTNDRIKNFCDEVLVYYKVDEDFLVNLGSTSNELHRLVMQAIDYVIHNDELLISFQIPKQFWSRIRRSWLDEHDDDIIDHFNFQFDGEKLKLCEYKADNVSTLFECAVVQEKWAQVMNLDYDFTSGFQLHRLLVRNWKKLNIKTIVHILVGNDRDEMVTALYIKKLMKEAGIDSKLCIMPDDLYWKDSVIVDKDDESIKIVWKLWKWETIFRDEEESVNDEHPCLRDILLNDQIRVMEPIWKSIGIHKAFLSVLRTMFPNLLNNGYLSLNDSIDEQSNGEKKVDNGNCIHPDKKNSRRSDEMIVSWMINGLFAGFGICKDQKQIIDVNNPLTICCIV